MEIALGQLAGLIAGGANNELPSRPLMQAQQIELTRRFELANEPPADIKPGDLVAFKEGLGCMTATGQETYALILWRMLNIADYQDRLHIRQHQGTTHDRYDCLLAHVTDDASALVFVPAELAHLRRVEVSE